MRTSTIDSSGKPLSTVALESIVDVRRTRLELLLKVLDVDGAVSRVSGGWTSTGQPWTYDTERYARVTEARNREQQLMVDYQRGAGCRMEFLQRALDDETAAACGRCDRCAGPWVDEAIPDAAVFATRERLRKVGVNLDPRAQWPTGMARLGVPVSGKISTDESMAPGRILARLTDLGWGQRLRDLLRTDEGGAAATEDSDPWAEPHEAAGSGPSRAEAPRELLEACVGVLRDWGWDQRPTGIVVIPSRSRPRLSLSVAHGLGEIGRLPVLGALDLAHGGPSGGAGGNSAFRLAGVWERLVVSPELARVVRQTTGPILLVDDLVDSRWTMTIAARALRQAGAEVVLPFALASAG